MQGKVALVTGAGAGIGRAIAIRLAREGAAVVVADVDAEAAAEAARYMQGEGGRTASIQVDVADEVGVRNMVRFAEQRFGGLDVLVNNVGIAPEPYFPEAEPAHWGRTLDVNLRGAMFGIQFAIPALRRRGGGAIINIASMAGMSYRPYDAPEYAASKAGLVHLTAALGSLKEPMNIRVNCVCPGWVETEAVRAALARMTREERERQPFPPPPILIQPEEIAEAVVMFVQDDTLAGQVMVWPDGEPWRFVPVNAWF
jgi:NAD(P)-dependent dehydrogenase (short-subunit alcohol dehydrogenase family)